MSKLTIFFLIVAFGSLCIIGFHLAIFMFKFLVGAMVLALIVIGFYIGRQTSRHR